VRHGFGVAEVAHGLILCLNETGGVRACVADPFVGQRFMKGFDTFTVPQKGAQAADRIYRKKK
jgi:hypothetical protein